MQAFHHGPLSGCNRVPLLVPSKGTREGCPYGLKYSFMSRASTEDAPP